MITWSFYFDTCGKSQICTQEVNIVHLSNEKYNNNKNNVFAPFPRFARKLWEFYRHLHTVTYIKYFSITISTFNFEILYSNDKYKRVYLIRHVKEVFFKCV